MAREISEVTVFKAERFVRHGVQGEFIILG
jgi:hypothetical protein